MPEKRREIIIERDSTGMEGEVYRKREWPEMMVIWVRCERVKGLRVER
ncbi:146_t:CDS:2 [Paraglomus brasilianum]|uniref:146_t:CDS:1 n=1 Tax=Paraglomus brasilianum TaxID=144538 RepID=A0A9N9GHD1_9GLOM|nr:146_t:CDS:2 [Paraglomus brasilianum]